MVSLDKNYSTFTTGLLIIAIIFGTVLTITGTEAGRILFILTTITIAILVLRDKFTKESTDKTYFFPFITDERKAMRYYFTGIFIAMVLIFMLSGVSKAGSVPPLGVSDLDVAVSKALTATALKATLDIAFVFAVLVIISPVLEEFATGVVVITLGGIFGKQRPLLSQFIGFLLSLLIFTILHKLNGSYVELADFAFALILRLILNLLMFFTKIADLAIGLHTGNNLMYFIAVHGFNGLIEALISPVGLVLGIFFALQYFVKSNTSTRSRSIV